MVTVSEFESLLKAPRMKSQIAEGLHLEERIKFHTAPVVHDRAVAGPLTAFKDFVKGLLPLDKFNTFCQLVRFPLVTTDIVDTAYTELERIFKPKNAFFDYQFTDNTAKADWETYSKNVLNEPKIWHEVGWEKLKHKPNGFVVVDMKPDRDSDNRLMPYFYWLDLQYVIDYWLADKDSLAYIIFWQTDTTVAYIDNTSWQLFEIDKTLKVLRELDRKDHDLKYCPVTFFWHTPIDESRVGIKKAPIVKELSNLDWYLFFYTSKRHLDLYAPYPIYSAYEADCNFENNETGEYCDGGFIRNADGQYKVSASGLYEKCPICSEKRIVGPGSFLEVPVPNTNEGIVDMRNPVQITEIDEKSLTYNVKECERLRMEILNSLIGTDGDVSNVEAFNESQIAARFESRAAVLNQVKAQFEKTQRFVDTTICKLRYGQQFVAADINWGTEFYLYTAADLYKQYELAKKAGLPNTVLQSILDQLTEVECNDNPIEKQRLMLLKQLEVYPTLTADEVLQLFEKNAIDKSVLNLKLNFTYYINRFEREHGEITAYNVNANMATRINKINEILKQYANEQ
jgi:hypothetical protein